MAPICSVTGGKRRGNVVTSASRLQILHPPFQRVSHLPRETSLRMLLTVPRCSRWNGSRGNQPHRRLCLRTSPFNAETQRTQSCAEKRSAKARRQERGRSWNPLRSSGPSRLAGAARTTAPFCAARRTRVRRGGRAEPQPGRLRSPCPYRSHFALQPSACSVARTISTNCRTSSASFSPGALSTPLETSTPKGQTC